MRKGGWGEIEREIEKERDREHLTWALETSKLTLNNTYLLQQGHTTQSFPKTSTNRGLSIQLDMPTVEAVFIQASTECDVLTYLSPSLCVILLTCHIKVFNCPLLSFLMMLICETFMKMEKN